MYAMSTMQICIYIIQQDMLILLSIFLWLNRLYGDTGIEIRNRKLGLAKMTYVFCTSPFKIFSSFNYNFNTVNHNNLISVSIEKQSPVYIFSY